MKKSRIMKLLSLILLLPILACSQTQNFQRINADTIQSRTGSSFVFVNDSLRLLQFLRGDSTGFPASSQSFGSGRLIFRGDAGIFWQDGNSRWRLDTSYSGNYVPTGDSITGIFYVTLKRLQDSNTVLRTDLKRKDDSTASTGYLPVHRLADSTSSLRTDLARKSITISTNAPLSGGGDLSTNRTLSVDTSTVGTGLTTLYQNSLKLAKTDTLSLSNRINLKADSSLTHTVNGTSNQITVSGSPLRHSASGSITLSTPQDIATSSTPQFARLGLGTAADTNMLTISQGTITTAKSLLNLTSTWNGGGAVIHRGIVENITNTSSSANSTLMDLKVGGTTKFSVDLSGNVSAAGNIGASNNLSMGGTLLSLSNAVFFYTWLWFDGAGDVQPQASVAKGRLLYSQGTTSVPIFEDYPWLYSSTSNLGFGLTDTSINKNISTTAQSADTSAINFSFTNTGKPQMFMRGITGNAIFAVDSQFVGIGTATPQKLISLSDGIDTYSIDVASDRLFFYNDAATPAAIMSADSQGTFYVVKNINMTSGNFIFSPGVSSIIRLGDDDSVVISNSAKFNGTITGSVSTRGSDAFTTTATTDTVTVTGGATTDYYFITLTGTAAPAAADLCTVEALVGKFVLHRSASGTSGLTYNWFRIK